MTTFRIKQSIVLDSTPFESSYHVININTFILLRPIQKCNTNDKIDNEK